MAKNELELSTPNVTVDQKATSTNNNSGNKQSNKKPGNKKPRRNVGKFFRDIIGELKKVTWGKFKSTKESKGVWEKTGIVLLIVFAFLVIVTAMDIGLTELLKLLIDSGTVA